MKINFTLIGILFFCLSALPGFSGKDIQKPKATVTPKTDSISVKELDSISNYSITINGTSNAVSINNEHLGEKKIETTGKQKNPANSIEINGEGNSVNIHQNGKGGQVKIQQNGTGNQVHVSQTNSEK